MNFRLRDDFEALCHGTLSSLQGFFMKTEGKTETVLSSSGWFRCDISLTSLVSNVKQYKMIKLFKPESAIRRWSVFDDHDRLSVEESWTDHPVWHQSINSEAIPYDGTGNSAR
jgi:hypothetical protein